MGHRWGPCDGRGGASRLCHAEGWGRAARRRGTGRGGGVVHRLEGLRFAAAGHRGWGGRRGRGLACQCPDEFFRFLRGRRDARAEALRGLCPRGGRPSGRRTCAVDLRGP